MSGNISYNKLLIYFYPTLFLIPLNFFILSDGMGSGIRWFFLKYQTTFMGDSFTLIATSLTYVLDGTLTGKSAFFEISPMISGAVLFIALMYVLSDQTKIAGAFTILSGIISLSSSILQYGITLHGPSGICIPFGSIILIVYGVILSLSVADPTGENPLKKYDYLFLLFGVFLIYSSWTTLLIPNDTIGTNALPYSILENHTVYLDELYQSQNDDRTFRYRFINVGDDHYASLFPIVTPVLVIPLYAIPLIFNIPNSDLLPLAMSHIAAALISALSVMFIYLACRFISRRKVALIAALVFAFATSTWSISSQSLYPHGMSELLLAIMIFLVIKNEYDNTPGNIVFLGICSGLFFFNRPSDSMLLLPVIGYILWYHREKTGYYFLTGFLSGLPFLLYNVLLFHNPFGGYSHIASRLSLDTTILSNSLGLLFAPNRGLFVFTPILILAIFGFWIIKNNNQPLYRFLEGSIIAMALTVLVYASFDDWQGGEMYGPRYLTCILPYLVIGICIFFDTIAKQPRNICVMAIIGLLITFSVFVQFVGVFYFRPSENPQEYFPNQFCSYDAWDYTDLVIINSLFHKSARPVIRNDNGEWIRKIIQEEENPK
jgi:hypothetical protein